MPGVLSLRRLPVVFGLVALLVWGGLKRGLEAQSRGLVTTALDETKLTTVKGGGKARLKGATDMGAADVSKPAGV